jgi:hypothetical protein
MSFDAGYSRLDLDTTYTRDDNRQHRFVAARCEFD